MALEWVLANEMSLPFEGQVHFIDLKLMLQIF